MAVPKVIQYLNLLSDFWVTYYQDANLIDKSMFAVAEVLKSHYFRFIQKSVPRPLQTFPVFEEQFWNIIELDSESVELVTIQGQDYFKYPLDEPYAHIPLLYNVPFSPTVRLKERDDYVLERGLNLAEVQQDSGIAVDSSILFKRVPVSDNNPFNGDPFTNNDIPKRAAGPTNAKIALYAPKVYLDKLDLMNEFGVLLGDESLSSEQYRAFLEGIFYIYIKGPSISSLNAGLNLAAGYPVARQTEAIRSVEIRIDPSIDVDEFILYSDQGNEYSIPRKFVVDYDIATQTPVNKIFPLLKFSGVTSVDPEGQTLTHPNFADPNLPAGVYDIYFEVDRLDTFLDNLKVVDNATQPNWWRESLRDSQLISELAPQLPIELRRNPALQEYLFSKYFRINTFGVFLDFRVFRSDFQKVSVFFEVLQNVKPSYKTYLIYENDLQVIDTIDTGVPVGDTVEVDSEEQVFLNYILRLEDIIAIPWEVYMALPYEDNGLQLGADPLEIGMALEYVAHSYDAVRFTLTISGDEDGGMMSKYIIGPGGPIVVGMEREIGVQPEEGVQEYTTLQLTEAPIHDPVTVFGVGPAYDIILEWSDVGADEYLIYRDEEVIGRSSTTTFTDPGITTGNYEYDVQASVNGFLSLMSNKSLAVVP
jgi:hypothetical protein